MASYDIFGNIAIIKSEGKTKKEKLLEAKELLKKPGIKTVLEKSTNIKGIYRTIKTKYLAGEKNLIALLKENSCLFKFNVEKCYFSPRLSNERQKISEKINQNDKVLVMFAGVGAYPIVIYKYKKPKKIIAIEINKECCKYFKENLKLNKIQEKIIEIIEGDVRKKINKGFIKKFGKFDVIVMARPNLKESFLKYALKVSKKGTRIFYYGFCRNSELNKLLDQLKKEATDNKNKIKFVEIAKAGEIAPYKYRYRIEIKVIK